MNTVDDVSPYLKGYTLHMDPVIIRVNSFTEASAKEFADLVSKAQNSGQPVIPVVIDSYGGEVYSLLSMIGSIKGSRIPVATVVRGKAMSCGAILFSFGTQRYMDPNATLMIHEVSLLAMGKNEEIKASATECERLNKKLMEMMASNCGKPPDHFTNHIHDRCHADWFLDSAEALSHNLATELRIPSLTRKISLQYTLV